MATNDDVASLREQIDTLTRQLAEASARPINEGHDGQERPVTSTKTPRLKDVNFQRFEGKEKYPGLGCGFERWIQSFEDTIKHEILFNNSTWTDEMKKSQLITLLSNSAYDYYADNREVWQRNRDPITFKALVENLKKKFGCKLDQSQLTDKLRGHKGPKYTWSEHLTYMRYIATLMEGDQSKLVLDIFCRHACPDHSANLISNVDKSSTDYTGEAEKALECLIQLTGDGTFYGKRKPRGEGHGEALTVEGRERPAKCYFCYEEGHILRNCPEKIEFHRKKKEQKPKARPTSEEADANMANSTESYDSKNHGEAWFADRDERTTGEPMEWLIDSGASHHMTHARENLVNMEPANMQIRVANNRYVYARMKGMCVMRPKGLLDPEDGTIVLREVYLVPTISQNLLSVAQLNNRGLKVTFTKGECKIYSLDGQKLKWSKMRTGNLWIMKAASLKATQASAFFANMPRASLQEWHERLGHCSMDNIIRMQNHDLAEGIELTNKSKNFCWKCCEGKQARTKQPQQDTSTSAPTDEIGAVVSIDLKGKIKPRDRHGNQYVMNMVDHASNWNQVVLLKRKSDALDAFKDHHKRFENEFSVKIKTVRIDGGELYSKGLRRYCNHHGIQLQKTEANTSASNGKAERMHRTILNNSRAMLFDSKLPRNFWGYAAKYAGYIRNRVPTRANADHRSPYETIYDTKPDVSGILKFGCTCSVWLPHNNSRIEKRSEMGMIIGIDEETKGYTVYLPRTKRIRVTKDALVSRHAQIQETVEQDNDNDDTLNFEAPDEQEALSVREIAPQTETPHREGTPMIHEPEESVESEYQPMSDEDGHYLTSDDEKGGDDSSEDEEDPTGEDTVGEALYCMDEEIDATQQETSRKYERPPEPKTVPEALNGPQKVEWEMAMKDELDALVQNETWKVVDRPTGRNTITCRWVYKVKYNADGRIERYKARLVARGFSQRYGIDYIETFSPVIKMSSFRLILTLGAKWGSEVRQADVPNAYLKGKLEEEIFMEPPEGVAIKGCAADQVLKLEKGLYGLKQAGKQWNDEANDFLVTGCNYSRSRCDPCLYYKHVNGGLSIVGLYVDDLIVVSENEEETTKTLNDLSLKYGTKDLGQIGLCLGTEVQKVTGGYHLNQIRNIVELLEEFGMDNCNPVSTPMDKSNVLYDDSSERLDTPRHKLYRRAIGCLLWLVNCTRPDIATAVNTLSSFVKGPTEAHWKGMKRVLRYLKGTKDLGLMIAADVSSPTPTVIVYSDADWAGDKRTRKSTTGGLLLLDGTPITWFSRRQPVIAISTAEAEYIAASTAIQECLWIRQLLCELSLWDNYPITLRCDNQSAIANMNNEMTKTRMKHIDIKYHFIRDSVANKKVKVEYCPSRQMTADIFTKPLERGAFAQHRTDIKVVANDN